MVYLYDACDQISDFCHQQLLRKMQRKISWTKDRRTEVKQYYPPLPSGSGGIINITIQLSHSNLKKLYLNNVNNVPVQAVMSETDMPIASPDNIMLTDSNVLNNRDSRTDSCRKCNYYRTCTEHTY